MSLIVCLTHDVDRVFKTYQYITHDLRYFNLSNLKGLFTKKNPYWNFETIMSLEDKYHVRSTFFFLEETIPFKMLSPPNWKLSLGKYRFSDPAVADMVQKLDAAGWEIGLHGSYNSFKDVNLLKREKANLEKVLKKSVVGIRQHYLNLDIPDTWVRQKKTGFLYDTTLGIKNDIGFPRNKYRPFFDSNSGLFIIPLALMDGYLFNRGRSLEHVWEKCLSIINVAEKNEATLTVLWHQRVFNEKDFPGYTQIYERLIIECERRNAKFMTCKDLLEKNGGYGKFKD